MGVWRRVATALAALTIGAAGLVVAPALVGVGESGAGAATTVPGAAPTVVQGALDLGPAPLTTMDVTLVLGWRDPSGLASELTALYQPGSSQYHHFLTPAAFDAHYAPSGSTVAAVRTWATSAGLSVTSVSPNNALVRLQGTTASLGRALGVTFDRFEGPGGLHYVANATAATLPAVLANKVHAVVGLSTLGKVSLSPVVRPSQSLLAYPSNYDPQQFWSMYNAPAQDTGQGQTLAILAEGDLSQPRQDLRTFESTYHLPQVPWTTIKVGAPSTDTSGDDEWDLDTQYATAFAPGVSSLLAYDTTSLSDSDILAEINRFVTDDLAHQASFSAGECEVLAQASGFLPSGDQVLQEAVAQGQTLFASSGDTGSFCPALVGVNGLPVGLPDVNYPASSPYAVGVGGTTILGGPSVLNEIGWYAGGGGMSLLEGEPSYQSSVGGSNLGLRRGVPDVSLDADPQSGYDVVINGVVQVVGGTSASSPSWLGIWTRAQGAKGPNLGFANDTIYAEPASTFHDITVGTNGLYPVTPGYDYVTGRGTPDIAAFVNSA